MPLYGIQKNINGNLRSPAKLTGVYRARVESNQDPSGQGKVQIRVPALHGLKNSGVGTESLPWATLLGQSAGYDYGSYIVPEVGEYVLVQFEDGDPYSPILMGSLYGSGSKSPKEYGTGEEGDDSWESVPGKSEVPEEAQRAVPSLKVLYKSPTGAMIAVDDAKGSEGIILKDGLGQHLSIATNLSSESRKGPSADRSSEGTSVELRDMNGQTITLTSSTEGNSIKLISDNYKLVISPDDDGILIHADEAEIKIDTDGNVSLKGKKVSVRAESTVDIHTDETVHISSEGSMSIHSSGHTHISASDGVTVGSPVTLIDPVF